MEATPEHIAKFVFYDEPKVARSINLQLEEGDNEYVFQLILNVLLEGLYIKYGSEFDINQLNDDILHKLNEYMKSIGFSLKRHANKQGHCYCKIVRINLEKPYMFVVDKHQKQKNDFIERKNLTDYYIDLGNSQLNFTHY